MVLISRSADRTEEIGRLIGAALDRGAFLALYGDLGGGKTCFTRGVVAAVTPTSAHMVASPTFAIMNEYPGEIPVYHFDFYRLGSADEIAELGFDEYFRGDGVCIVEWAERLGDELPIGHLGISFEEAGDECRKISLQATGAGSRAVLDAVAAQLQPEDFL